MEKKTYKFTIWGTTTEVTLKYDNYCNNDTLALQLFCRPDDDEWEMFEEEFGAERMEKDPFVVPFATVTVNLPESRLIPKNTQFVDTNDLPGIGEFLESNDIAIPMGLSVHSGFCSYPLYMFKR